MRSSPSTSTSAPSFVKFAGQGRHTVSLLDPQRVQAADRGRPVGKQGHHCQRLGGIGHRGQVDFDPLQRSGPVTVMNRPNNRPRPHLVQHVGEPHVSLKALLAQAFDGDLGAGVDRGGRQEVAGVAGVGLDLIVGRAIAPAGDDQLLRLAGIRGPDQFGRVPNSSISRIVIATYGQLVCGPIRSMRTSLRAYGLPGAPPTDTETMPRCRTARVPRQSIGADDDRREPVCIV